jgi:hypothetical protein
MVIYNVTLSIDAAVSSDWLAWMRQTHIVEIMKTGCFMECRISKVNGEEEGGHTYSVMYLAKDQNDLDRYNTSYAQAMQKSHAELFAGKFAAFRTTLEVIEQFHNV